MLIDPSAGYYKDSTLLLRSSFPRVRVPNSRPPSPFGFARCPGVSAAGQRMGERMYFFIQSPSSAIREWREGPKNRGPVPWSRRLVDNNSRRWMHGPRTYSYIYGRAVDATFIPFYPWPPHPVVVQSQISHQKHPMLCPVIQISEVVQVIIDHLVQVSPKSVVSLACTCKALEEQALRTLWSNQDSLGTLVRSTLLPDIRSCSLPQQQVRDIVANI